MMTQGSAVDTALVLGSSRPATCTRPARQQDMHAAAPFVPCITCMVPSAKTRVPKHCENLHKRLSLSSCQAPQQ